MKDSREKWINESEIRARVIDLWLRDHGFTFNQIRLDRLGMTRTSLVWRNDQDPNVADRWNDQGQPPPHEKRSKVRAAGSMNTTISDLSKFTAALVKGDGLSAASRTEITKPSLHLTTAGLLDRKSTRLNSSHT